MRDIELLKFRSLRLDGPPMVVLPHVRTRGW